MVIVYTTILLPIGVYTFTHNKNSDHNRGYENNIIVQKEMVKYCEQNNMYNKNIVTHFLMSVNLTDSIMGYLSSNKFNNVTTYKIDNSTDYVIISSNEYDDDFAKEIENNNGQLVVEFKEKQAWCKLYSFNNNVIK